MTQTGFISGAWFAYNEVLEWINTQDSQTIDKKKLYKEVMQLGPSSLMSKYKELTNSSDSDVWNLVHENDLWVFDKLILSRKLNHICGPVGVDVPTPTHYVVRPCVNISGMGRGSTIEWIEKSTDALPAGYFWQEIFIGDHLSVDFQFGSQIRCTQGFQTPGDLTRFDRWILVDLIPVMPPLVMNFIQSYPIVNVEMINGKVIEIHLRGNPDFNDGAIEILPIWLDIPQVCPKGFTFVSAAEGDRIGFYKRY